MIHYNINTAVGQKTGFLVLQWQMTILLRRCVTSLTDVNFKDISIKCSKVEQIHDFSCEIIQESQQASAWCSVFKNNEENGEINLY